MTVFCTRLKTLTARDLMTAPAVTIAESASIASALAILEAHEITGMPVVNDRGKLAGMLSVWDIVREQTRHASPEGVLVGHCMTQPIGTVANDRLIVDVARSMCNNHWHRLPVVDGRGELLGVISTMDVLAAIVNSFEEAEAEPKP